MRSAQSHPPIIAHVVEHCVAGTATFVHNLIVSQLHDELVSAVHLIGDPAHLEPRLVGVAELHPYKSSRNPMRFFSISRAIYRILTEIGPDVVILHSSFPGFWGRIGPKRDWKVIYCAHGWAFTNKPDAFQCWFYSTIEAYLSRRCDAIVSISRHDFQRANAVGVAAPIHEMIHHGVIPGMHDERFPIHTTSNAINLAFVGRFTKTKGIYDLFKMFEDPRLDHIHVWFAGGDRLNQNLELPVRPNFHFLGWRANGEIDAILKQVDALIVPSRAESFGLVALEAMRNAKPVIANRVGGLAEVVIEGQNGRFINVDEIEECRQILLQLNRDELRGMGAIAHDFYIREFQWDHVYPRWKKLIERVCGQGSLEWNDLNKMCAYPQDQRSIHEPRRRPGKLGA